MADEVKDVTTPSNEPERTFTQSELNAIIGDRLAQERKKYADYDELKGKAAKFDEAEEASKTELQKAKELNADLQKKLDAFQKADTERKLKEKISQETGVPVSVLRGETEEDLRSQAEEILKIYKPGNTSYPNVHDAGETQKISGGSTAQQFADWFNQNIKS
ncbi:MAG: hypothetical protein IKI38_05765 [Mogibacterium sp.]|nr:hypothetical protein [Mogibacterium sp.]